MTTRDNTPQWELTARPIDYSADVNDGLGGIFLDGLRGGQFRDIPLDGRADRLVPAQWSASTKLGCQRVLAHTTATDCSMLIRPKHLIFTKHEIGRPSSVVVYILFYHSFPRHIFVG